MPAAYQILKWTPTLFSLSLANENKIIIGASCAIPTLINILENGRTRGQKDAATALFNLCVYQGNRTCCEGRATKKLKQQWSVRDSTIPLLIDLTRTGIPRNMENATSILLSLCKRDSDNLACISKLCTVIPLMELAKNGSERAQRKAKSLLEHLQRAQQVQH
ncbi:U-box domain-containing protein 11-like protein, partial [Tanacetum coccineum]